MGARSAVGGSRDARGALALALCVGGIGCAQGFNEEVPSNRGREVTPPDAGGARPSSGSGSQPPSDDESSTASGSSTEPEPCMMGEVTTCTCADTDTEGEASCLFDAASSEDGFFSECSNCPQPLPEPGTLCDDGKKNGFETATDCGGSDCDGCPAGKACVENNDCVGSICIDGLCSRPETGSAGASGSAAAGTGGAVGPPPPPTPVQDCTGQPEGTPCVRDCLINDRAMQCDNEGDCECVRL